MAGSVFSIKKTQLEKALYKGMVLQKDGSVACDGDTGIHYFILPPIDSGMEDCPWGRLRFTMQLPENSVCYVYAAACNDEGDQNCLMDPQVSLTDKKKYLSSLRCLRFINKPDVLLYEIEGRYLWIAVEVIGEGVAIKDLEIQVPGDNFMNVFPEVYREKNSFFHRYLSIFSSIHNDFQEQLDHREDMLDIDKAPKKFLELFLKWVGIDVDGGFLEEEDLKALLRESGNLIKYKGTRKSIEKLCELFVGEKPTILERGLMQKYVRSSEQEIYDSLYGDSPYDVTLLMANVVEEHKKEQLLHLLRQFKPIRCRLHILFLKQRGVLDEHTYLDWNAVTFSQEEGNLDVSTLLDGAIVLQ